MKKYVLFLIFIFSLNPTFAQWKKCTDGTYVETSFVVSNNNIYYFIDPIGLHYDPATDVPTSQSTDCNVYIRNNENTGEFNINIECGIHGIVKYQLFDLLGNEVLQGETEKKTYSVSVPVSVKLNPGVYFTRVSIGDKQMFYNKINIIN